MLGIRIDQLKLLDENAKGRFETRLRAQYRDRRYPEGMDFESTREFCCTIGLTWESHVAAIFDFVTGERFQIEGLEMFPKRNDEEEGDYLVRVEMFFAQYGHLMR